MSLPTHTQKKKSLVKSISFGDLGCLARIGTLRVTNILSSLLNKQSKPVWPLKAPYHFLLSLHLHAVDSRVMTVCSVWDVRDGMESLREWDASETVCLSTAPRELKKKLANSISSHGHHFWSRTLRTQQTTSFWCSSCCCCDDGTSTIMVFLFLENRKQWNWF